MHRTFRPGKGFTLVELMIVVALISILAAVAVPTFSHYIDEAKTAEARENLSAIGAGALAYYKTAHFYDETGTNKTAYRYPGCQRENAAYEGCKAAHYGCAGSIPPTIGARMAPEAASDAVWARLSFALSQPHYYCYTYTSAADHFRAGANASLSHENDSHFVIRGEKEGRLLAIVAEDITSE